METNNSLSNSTSKLSEFSSTYNPIKNADVTLKSSVYSDYGQDWLVEEPKTFQELGENSLKLKYLEKSLKSIRRLEQRKNENENETIDEEDKERYKFDTNAIIAKKFPFKAEEFRYPNDNRKMPETVYVKYSDEYGSKKPNDMELPCNIINLFIFVDKYHPINNEFSRGFTSNYRNNSLNTAPSNSKVHSSLDSVV
jgi:hypothetical protein